MTIRTAITEAFDLDYPIVLAPMGWISGGRLATAVSNAGGLGLIGGAYGDPPWLRQELDLVRAATGRQWGVGFITWHVDRESVDLALSYNPSAVFLSFGDPLKYASRIKAASCALICQIQEVEDARQAVAAGADVIVAQGSEAGGHGAVRATLPLVPAVVDAVAPVPVLAAGGIADGRGLAAALMLGAQGAVLGTRFFAAAEALGHERAQARILAAQASDTIRTRVFDPPRGFNWPEGITARALRNDFSDRWHGREAELAAALDVETETFARAARAADFDTAQVFAGEAVDLIDRVEPAAELVRRIGAEAERLLRTAPQLLDDTSPLNR
jgi:nitronate monooxygenase